MITVQRLEKTAVICRRIRELRNAIQHTYNTYRSPSFDRSYRKSTGHVSDPVVNAVNHLQDLHSQLAECLDYMYQFENDLSQIDNNEIIAIIRCHYILGDTWSDTSWKMYQRRDHSAVRKKLIRYLEREVNKDGQTETSSGEDQTIHEGN